MAAGGVPGGQGAGVATTTWRAHRINSVQSLEIPARQTPMQTVASGPSLGLTRPGGRLVRRLVSTALESEAVATAAEAPPAELVLLLVNRLWRTREQIAATTKAKAIERLNRYWTVGR